MGLSVDLVFGGWGVFYFDFLGGLFSLKGIFLLIFLLLFYGGTSLIFV